MNALKRYVLLPVILTLVAVFLPFFFREPPVKAEQNTPDEPEATRESPAPAVVGTDGETNLSVYHYGQDTNTTMAQYLPYALAAEMPASFEPEALKAQAVAARTYILYSAEHRKNAHPSSDVCTDSACCLAYKDETSLRAAWGAEYNEKMARIQAAVAATDGQVMSYNEQIILAAFHSSSAEKTEDAAELWGELPYLDSVSSPETETDVPNYITTVTVTADNFRESILAQAPEAELNGEPSGWITGAKADDSGRIRYLTIGGVDITGSALRQTFALRSTAFTVTCGGDVFTFTVTGYGHGLGLSQYGANVMAQKGCTYVEILEHYYPGAELE